METKHTPGPWIIESTEETIWIGTPKNNNTKVDDIILSIDQDGLKTSVKEKNTANAKLIAAAPDLLEALLNIMGDVLEHVHPDDYKKARAAIKKATE